MTLVKGGHTVEDPRLGRVPLFDERSRRFGVTETLDPEVEPADALWDLEEWFDQLAEGACVAFSLGHELAAMPVRILGLDYDGLIEWYHEIQHRDPWEGCYLGPKCPREPNPNRYEGTAILAGAKLLKELGYFDEYRWAFGWHEMARALVGEGPVVIGVNWHREMAEPDSNGFIRPTGPVDGGHAVCVVGQVVEYIAGEVDMDLSYFIIHNSWGRKWGKDGRCFITFRDMDTLLEQRGEVLVPMLRRDLGVGADEVALPFVGFPGSRVVHNRECIAVTMRCGVDFAEYPSLDMAVARGRRPCRICKPG